MAGEKLIQKALQAAKEAHAKRYIADPLERDINLGKFLQGTKTVNDEGDLFKLYHITKGDISEFIPGGPNPLASQPSGPAIWLSANPEYLPATHSVGYPGEYAAGTNVMPLWASMKNPLVVEKGYADQKYGSGFPFAISPEGREKLIADGYDSVINRMTQSGQEEYLALHPNQLKSATGNAGTFDPNSPRIEENRGGEVDAALHAVREHHADGKAVGQVVDDRYLTGGGEIIPEQRSASYSTNTSIGPFSGGAILAGQEDAIPIVGGRFTTQLPEGLSATLSRTGQAGAPMEYARDAIRLAKQLEAGQLALEASRVGSQGLPSYGLQYSGQIGKQGGAPSYYPQPKGHWFVEAGGTPSTPERHVRGGARFNFADGGEVSHMANGGISYSGDFSTPDYYQVYNALPNAGLAGQLVQRMFPNPSTTGAYTAYMNQLASSALPPPAPNPTPFVTNVPNVSGPPVPLMPTSNFNFSQFGLGSNAAPALNALAAQQSALALPKMVQPENKAHGGEVDAALHAVRHHLAGGGFLSDMFSGPDYLSTGEVASPTNWGDPELASDFFKADKALRLAREVQGNADDVTGSIPARAPLTAPRPGKVEERELPAPPVKIPFAAPERGVSMLSSDISPESVTSLPLAYAPTPVAAPAAAAIDQATGKLTARIPDEPSGTALTKQQADYIIRTIAAETSGKSPEETQAIASVILNRINSGKYGSSPEAVLFAKRQFEPWMNPAGANYPMKISPTSQRYLDARAALEAALAGEDITRGATNFWGPKSQYSLGRDTPDWALEMPDYTDIGATRFHRPNKRAEGGEVEGYGDGGVIKKALNILTKPASEMKIIKQPPRPAEYIEPNSFMHSYVEPSSGGYMNVVTRPTGPRGASVIDLYVPEEFRGQGVGKFLQSQVMEDFPSLAGQVSSKAAATNAYNAGRRMAGNEGASLDDIFRAIDENSSVNMWTEKAHGGEVDDALRVVREHHADGERVGKAPVATDNSERVRAAEDAARLAKQIQAYEASMANIRQQPQDIQSMTHAPEKPRAPISIEALGKNREFGSAPYDVAAPLSSLAQGAYDLKTMPLYAAGTVFPPAAALGTALDTAEGVASGSPTQVAMGALGGPLKVARNVIAPLSVATGVTAPDEAEAAIPFLRAMRLTTVRNLPKDEKFLTAVRNTPHAVIQDEHLVMPVTRNQKYEQSGEPSVRGGVFYLPEGSSNQRYYTGTGHNFAYGGPESYQGETAVSNPLFVKGATGGKAPEEAYKYLMGKEAFKEMQNDVMRSLGGYYLPRDIKQELVQEFLDKHAPSLSGMEEYVLTNSLKGNQLRYALQEAAAAEAARQAGHDAILGYSTSRTKGPFLSEIFDVRERSYPRHEQAPDIWPMFLPKEKAE